MECCQEVEVIGERFALEAPVDRERVEADLGAFVGEEDLPHLREQPLESSAGSLGARHDFFAVGLLVGLLPFALSGPGALSAFGGGALRSVGSQDDPLPSVDDDHDRFDVSWNSRTNRHFAGL